MTDNPQSNKINKISVLQFIIQILHLCQKFQTEKKKKLILNAFSDFSLNSQMFTSEKSRVKLNIIASARRIGIIVLWIVPDSID